MSCGFPDDKWEKIKNQRSAVQIPIVTILTHESFLWPVVGHGYFGKNEETINVVFHKWIGNSENSRNKSLKHELGSIK